MEWKTIRVFISSTFSDMHAERDYLVKYVFPVLAEWCEQRRLRLVDIDLRWGITAADTQARNTVLACLKNIDECRPFFLCLLGQRRGWVPQAEDISEQTKQHYPDITTHIGYNSITEIEVEHALLSPMYSMVNDEKGFPVSVGHALFYFRKDRPEGFFSGTQTKLYTNAVEPDEQNADTQLADFKEKIRRNWQHVAEYDCEFDRDMVSPELLSEGAEAAQGRFKDFTIDGRPLSDVIIESLKKEIEREFPDRQGVAALTAQQAEMEQQSLFSDQIREGFIRRTGDDQDLNAYLSGNDQKLFVLTAPAGLGKTMLLAYFLDSLHRQDIAVYARFCGVSDLSADVMSLWKSILEEAGINCPPTLNELVLNIQSVLTEMAGKQNSLLVIDAVNQLDGGMDMLLWLPRKLPDGLKLIVSVKEDDASLPAIQQFKHDSDVIVSTVRPFSDGVQKRAMIDAYLERYLKNLDQTHIDFICGLPASDNPLYLKVLLSELRVFGSFKDIGEQVKRYGSSPKEAFSRVLERMETDISITSIPSKKAVANLFGLLACARKGLSEDELLICMHRDFAGVDETEITNAIRLYIRQMRPFLTRSGGRTGFLYESFLIAANERYTSFAVENHQRLAACFRSAVDINHNDRFEGESSRAFEELPYHLSRAGEDEILKSMLGDYLWLKAKAECCGVDAAVTDYALIQELPQDLVLIRETLRLSAPALRENPGRLFDQLWGRLCEEDAEEVKGLLAKAETEANSIWLKPIRCVWNPPGESLMAVIKTGEQYFPPVPLLYQQKLFCIYKDRIAVLDLSTNIQTVRYKQEEGYSDGALLDSGRLIFSVKNPQHSFIEIWDAEEARPIALPPEMEGCSAPLLIIGDRLIAKSGKQELGVFDKDKLTRINTINCYYELPPSVFFLTGMQVSESREIVCITELNDNVAVGFSNGAISAFDFKTGAHLIDFFDHADKIYAMAQCGNRLLSGSNDGTTRIWDGETGRCEKTMNVVTSGIHVDETRTYTKGGWGSGIRIWDTETLEQTGTVEGHNKTVRFMTGHGGILVTSAMDETVRVWNLRAQRRHEMTEKHQWGVNSLIYYGNRLISGAGGGDVKIWDSSTMNCISTIKAHTEPVLGLTVAGDVLLTASGDDQVRLWSLEDFSRLENYHCSKGFFTTAATGKETFFLGSHDGSVRRWEFTGDLTTQIRHGAKVNRIIPFQSIIFTCSDDGTVAMLDEKNLREIKRQAYGSGKINNMFMAGECLVLAFEDGKIRLVHKETLECMITLEGHGGPVRALAECGGKLVSGGDDCQIKIWGANSQSNTVFWYDYPINVLTAKDNVLFAGAADGRVLWMRFEDKNVKWKE